MGVSLVAPGTIPGPGILAILKCLREGIWEGGGTSLAFDRAASPHLLGLRDTGLFRSAPLRRCQEEKLNLEDWLSDLETVDRFIAEMKSVGLPTKEAEDDRSHFKNVLEGRAEE